MTEQHKKVFISFILYLILMICVITLIWLFSLQLHGLKLNGETWRGYFWSIRTIICIPLGYLGFALLNYFSFTDKNQPHKTRIIESLKGP